MFALRVARSSFLGGLLSRHPVFRQKKATRGSFHHHPSTQTPQPHNPIRRRHRNPTIPIITNTRFHKITPEQKLQVFCTPDYKWHPDDYRRESEDGLDDPKSNRTLMTLLENAIMSGGACVRCLRCFTYNFELRHKVILPQISDKFESSQLECICNVVGGVW